MRLEWIVWLQKLAQIMGLSVCGIIDTKEPATVKLELYAADNKLRVRKA